VLIFVAGSLSTLLVTMGVLEFGFRHEIEARNQQALAARLLDVAANLANHPDDARSLAEEVLGDAPMVKDAPTLLRVLKGGRLQVESAQMDAVLPPGRSRSHGQIQVLERRYLVAERAVGLYLIQGALDVTEDSRMIRSYRQNLLATFLLVTAGCSLLGAWVSHLGLRPLRSITQSAQGVTAQGLRQSLDPGQVPKEMGDMVEALNAMLDRLDHAFERLSRFSGDLAHEFRTPINNLMGEAEVILSRERSAEEYRQVIESSMEEFQRLSRLISRMLFLARAEAPATLIKPVPISVGLLLEKIMAFFEAVAEEKGVCLRSEGSGTLWGDPEMLQQALANLVANALEATPKGGEVLVRAGIRDENRACLEVIDNGRGIPPDDLPALFDRFFRTSQALTLKSPGTGLGLAIVQSIARLHGGDVQAHSQLGAGTTVCLHFPAGDLHGHAV
jgi:two-component system heavy metal sensor histidine kinase CusS